MPIYEYQCADCHHQFDVLQKIHDEPIKQCPQCSKEQAVRLVSAAGFQLKGTGWYATDFKDKGKIAVKLPRLQQVLKKKPLNLPPRRALPVKVRAIEKRGYPSLFACGLGCMASHISNVWYFTFPG